MPDCSERGVTHFAVISSTQYGWTRMTVVMYRRLPQRGSKGLFFNHAMTLCRDHDTLRKMAVVLRYLQTILSAYVSWAAVQNPTHQLYT